MWNFIKLIIIKSKTPSPSPVIRGVKKNRGTGTGTGKPGNRETGVPVPVPVWKNQKPGTLVPVPGFWYPVLTGLPDPGEIYIFYYYYFLVKALHILLLLLLLFWVLNCCSKGVFLVHLGLFTYLFLLFIVLKFSLCT